MDDVTVASREVIAKFFESIGITHAEKVEFDLDGYTVHTFRRDEDGKYVASQDFPGEPIREEIRYDFKEPLW